MFRARKLTQYLGSILEEILQQNLLFEGLNYSEKIQNVEFPKLFW